MYRVILWGMGIDYNTHLNLIKYMESAGKIKVVAITSTEVPNLQYIEPSLARMNRDVHTNVEYPVLLLDDVELHCNHETDAQNAISTWNRRCKKVNLDNLFVEMYTLDRNIAEKFCQLEKYEKKVCFVQFKVRLKI